MWHGKTIREKKDFPAAPHYAALVYDGYSCDDGYGGTSYNKVVEYVVFKDKAEMQAWVAREETKTTTRKPYSIIESFPKEVKIEIKVSV